jgi:hypothetical protein
MPVGWKEMKWFMNEFSDSAHFNYVISGLQGYGGETWGKETIGETQA